MKNFLNFIMISILMSILPISIDQNTDTTTIDKINSITEEKNITPLAIKPIDEHVIVLFEGENTYGSYLLSFDEKNNINICGGGKGDKNNNPISVATNSTLINPSIAYSEIIIHSDYIIKHGNLLKISLSDSTELETKINGQKGHIILHPRINLDLSEIIICDINGKVIYKKDFIF